MELKPIIAAAGLSMIATNLFAAPLEENAIYPGSWSRTDAQAIADDASMLIRRSRYRCDSVSSIRSWLTGGGFTVFCNGFRYEYEIEDRGGRWTVTVQ